MTGRGLGCYNSCYKGERPTWALLQQGGKVCNKGGPPTTGGYEIGAAHAVDEGGCEVWVVLQVFSPDPHGWFETCASACVRARAPAFSARKVRWALVGSAGTCVHVLVCVCTRARA